MLETWSVIQLTPAKVLIGGGVDSTRHGMIATLFVLRRSDAPLLAYSARSNKRQRQQSPGGGARARSHCRFVPPLIHFIPDLLAYSVPLNLKRQCDRTLGGAPGRRGKKTGAPRSARGKASAAGSERKAARGTVEVRARGKAPTPPESDTLQHW
jgi:hypothetical protein